MQHTYTDYAIGNGYICETLQSLAQNLTIIVVSYQPAMIDTADCVFSSSKVKPIKYIVFNRAEMVDVGYSDNTKYFRLLEMCIDESFFKPC